jgi:glycine cleavage system H protein
MSQVLPELRYARSHEWARVEDDGTVTVGHQRSRAGSAR